MSKIYTKTGDKGTTGLVDGSRVSKAHLRIETLGELDEANAMLGLLATKLPARDASRMLLEDAQHMLFACGSRVAEPTEVSQLAIALPDKGFIARYEASIDEQTASVITFNSIHPPWRL